MRTFVAVFPPSEVSAALFRAARDLPTSEDFRLVEPEKIHLTLKFLGDVTEDDLDRVTRALGPLGESHEPFEVETSGFGAFPSERRARILWTGIGEGAGSLRALAREVEALLEPCGFEREGRPYVPHLTLGRARGRPAKFDQSEGSQPTHRFTVSGVNLVRSVPGRDGVTYSTLETYRF